MKRLWPRISFCVVLAASSAFAAPPGSSGATSATYSGGGVVGAESHGIPELNAYRKQRAIDALIHEGRDMQRADGCTLRTEHHAYLQAELKGILAGNY